MPAPGTHGYQPDAPPVSHPPKKKKKPTSTSSTSSSSSSSSGYTNSSSAEYSSGYTPPPSYAKPPKRKKPKPQIEITQSQGPSFTDLLGSVHNDIVTPHQVFDPNAVKPPKAPKDNKPDPRLTATNKNPSLSDLIGLTGARQGADVPTTNPQLTDLLKQVEDPNMRTLRGKGYSLGDENLDPEKNPFEFAWVPEQWKHQNNKKNANLKRWWDEDFIQNYIHQDVVHQSDIEQRLTDVITHQFQTRYNYLYQRNQNLSTEATDALTQAAQHAANGDFTYLQRKLKENPDLLNLPEYNDEFGVLPGDVWDQWQKDRPGISDPYVKSARRYRTEQIVRSYEKIRKSYRISRDIVQNAIDRYEKKYNNSVDFAKNNTSDDAEYKKKREAAEKAGPAVPDLTPPTSAEDQALLDSVGNFANVRRSKTGDMLTLIGVNEFDPDMVKNAFNSDHKYNHNKIQEVRQRIKEKYNLDSLPTITDMLAIKVQEGNLDPNDDQAVREWIERFNNPMHPDTRAMYIGWAMHKDPSITEEEAVDFINDPIKRYIKMDNRRAKVAEQKALEERDAKDAQGFDVHDLNDFDDMLNSAGGSVGLHGYTDDSTGGGSQLGVKTEGDKEGVDVTVGQPLMWTIDKLARPLYSVAGAVDSWYSLDKTPSDDWTDHGFGKLTRWLDPISVLTGKSWLDSIDEAAQDPSSLGDPFKEGYRQFLRGSGLPGTDDNIIPTTFSRVIANNALRDENNNIYDKSWYQHVAGLALDLGLDPLNYIGVGFMPDVLKLGAKTVEGLQDTVGREAHSYDVLRTLNDTSRGAVASHVSEVRNVLGKYPEGESGVPLVARPEPDPINPELLQEHKSLSTELAETQAQMEVYAKQTGVEHMYDQLDEIQSDLAGISLGEATSLRVGRILTPENSTRVMGTNLTNFGGRFYEDFLKPLREFAIEHGPTTLKYREVGGKLTTVARDAQRAQAELDDVTTFGGYHPGVKENIEARINKAFEHDDEFNGPHSWYEPDVAAFLKTDKAKEFKPKNGFNPSAAFAQAMGVTPKQFSKMFSDVDVYKALTQGSRMLVEQHPRALRNLMEASDRVKNSLHALKNPDLPASVRDAHLVSLQVGYTMNSELTLAGALKYLEELGKLKSVKGKWLDKPLAQHLQRLDDRIQKEFDTNGATPMDDYFGSGNGEFPTQNSLGQTPRKAEVADYDFAGKSLDEIRADLGTSMEDLTAIQNELRTQLDALKLDRTKEVTGFPPAQAHQMNEILPRTSEFRLPNGEFDFAKIEKKFTFTPKSKGSDGEFVHEPFRISYKLDTPEPPKGMSLEEFKQSPDWIIYQQEQKFFRILRDVLVDEQRGAYRGVKTDTLVDKGDITPHERAARKDAEKRRAEAIKAEEAKSGPSILHPEGNDFTLPGKPDTTLVVRKKGDSPVDLSHAVGPRTRRMPPEPTWDEFRRKFPIYAKRKQKNPEGVKPEETIEISRAISDTPHDPIYSIKLNEVGRITANQKSLRKTFDQYHHAWTLKYNRAKELDLAGVPHTNNDHLLTFDEYKSAQQKAYDKAWSGIKDSLKEKGSLDVRPRSMEVTFAGLAKEARRKAVQEARLAKAEAKIRHAEDSTLKGYNAELDRIRAKLRAKEAEIEKAYQEAVATSKVMATQTKVENTLQILQSPAKMTRRMVSLHLMGTRKNLQWTGSLFKGVENAVHLLPETMRQNFANTFVRPSKLVSEPESIRIRAMWESMTPTVLHSIIGRLKQSFRGTTESDRFGMLKAYRDGREYEGPNSQAFDAVKTELKDIEDIFNGVHPNFFLKGAHNPKGLPLSITEIQKFLPNEWNFNLDTLFRARTSRMAEQGIKRTKRQAKGEDPFGPKPDNTLDLTIADIREAIKATDLPLPKDFNDPFRMAWVMQLAAHQAHHRQGVLHAISETFGVKVPAVGTPKRKLALQLESRYGWKKGSEIHPDFSPDVLFPKEAWKDMQALMKFTERGPEQAQLLRMLDTVTGYWKQGMTIYNPGYYTRNLVGEVMASWLDGVKNPKWYRMAKDVHKFSRGEGANLAELIAKYKVLEGAVPNDVVSASKVLFPLKGGVKVTVEDALREFVRTGMKANFVNTDLEHGVRGVANSLKDSGPVTRGLRKTNEVVHQAGEGFEDWLRMAHFLAAMQDSGKGTIKAAANHAAEKVTKYHFDYSDFSKFDKAVMLRAFPFYKWTRRGAPLMLAHMFLTPGKITAIPKVMDAMSGLGFDPVNAMNDSPVLSTSDVYEDKNGILPDYDGIAPSWVKDLFSYQMQPTADDEYAHYFRMQTPQIDGLNAAFSLIPGSNGLGGMFGDSAAYPLLNPLLKGGIELGQNKGLDPDFPYEIYGGQYNEYRGLNPVESIATYALRQANPWTGFLAKLSKNGDLGPLSVGNDIPGREASRDILSQLTGGGFYQAKDEKPGEGGLLSDLLKQFSANGQNGDNIPSVDPADFSELPMSSGDPAAPNTDGKGASDILSALTNGGSFDSGGFSGGGKSNWINYPKHKWHNYGNGGYGGSSYGSSYGSSSSSGGTEFWDLIMQIIKDLDQGNVIE